MTEQNFTALRAAMVASQLRTTGVNDARVVAAMADVPRERFVGERYRTLAYLDRTLPLTDKRALPAPMILGRLLTEARIVPTDRALVIGAGGGYAPAVLARLAAHVVALEEDQSIVMAEAPPAGVERRHGPLVAGWADGAPYDVILFDGAIERLPAAIVDQLADGGRLAAPLVDRGVVRLAIGRKVAGAFAMTSFADAAAPVLPGFATPASFSF